MPGTRTCVGAHVSKQVREISHEAIHLQFYPQLLTSELLACENSSQLSGSSHKRFASDFGPLVKLELFDLLGNDFR